MTILEIKAMSLMICAVLFVLGLMLDICRYHKLVQQDSRRAPYPIYKGKQS